MKYRKDIDGLRALAVTMVVLFHAFPSWFPSGFAGVDVFFVISGFLISSITIGEVNQSTFSIKTFYERRIRRIFPALLTVLASVGLFGLAFINKADFLVLCKHIAAGAGFASNFVLWNESGYFDKIAESKPLLHLWSLGIEEQFYLAWPVLAYAAMKFRKGLIPAFIALGIGASLAFSIYLVVHDTTAAFYSPLSRAWELLFGSCLAWMSVMHESKVNAFVNRFGKALSVCFVALLAAIILFVNDSEPFPGLLALAPVLLAATYILRGPEGVMNRWMSKPWIVTVGKWSYPLYLWHWPVFTFARLINHGPLSTTIMLMLTAACFVLAWMTVKWIETPLRKVQSKELVKLLLLGVFSLGGACGMYFSMDVATHQEPSTTNKASIECGRKYGAVCWASNESPKVLFMGDSHSQHLFDSFEKSSDTPSYLVGTCAPLDGASLHTKKGFHPCAPMGNFMSQKMQALKDHPTIHTVIFSAIWRPALTQEIRNARETQMWGGYELVADDKSLASFSGPELMYQALIRTMDKVNAAGKNMVFVRDNPDLATEFEDECKLNGAFVPSECSLPKSSYASDRKLEDDLVARLKSRYSKLLVIDPMDTLCDDKKCYFVKNGVNLYKDNHHLTFDGGKMVSEDIHQKMKDKGWLK